MTDLGLGLGIGLTFGGEVDITAAVSVTATATAAPAFAISAAVSAHATATAAPAFAISAAVSATATATAAPAFAISAAVSATATATATARLWIPSDVTGFLWYLDANDLSAGNVTTWTGHGPTFTEATNPPVMSATSYTGSLPGVTYNGTNQLVSAIGITTFGNGDDAAWSHVWSRRLVAAGTSKTHWCSGHSTAAHNESIVEVTNATPLIRWTKTDDAAATANAGAVAADTTAHVVSSVATGTAISTWFDGTLDANATAENVGQTTLDQMSYGASLKGVTKAGFANLVMHRAAAYSVALSTANRNICEAWAAL